MNGFQMYTWVKMGEVARMDGQGRKHFFYFEDDAGKSGGIW